MRRISAMFIAFCMVLISGSVGAVLYLAFGLNGASSAIAALALLTSLALYNTVTARVHDRTDVGDQIADLSRGTADLARQVAEIARRLNALESRVEGSAAKPRAADPLTTEMSELGELVRQLAETVAAHENELRNPRSPSPAASPSPQPADAALTADRGDIGAPDPKFFISGTGRFRGMSRDNIIATISSAVEANRIDLYLQPIVTLPQRKVRYYEAMSRLRTSDGDVVPADDFLSHAESGGMMPKIDNLLLFRCVQVVRRLLLKNRDVGLFCNISVTTLSDPTFFQQFLEFMEANRVLAPAMLFEFKQSAFRDFGAIENESLAALAERGFRFSMDHVTDLHMEPKDLAERGFRFIKVPAKLLLNRTSGAHSDIHPADLSDLLARSNIDLIAERIESESAVIDLLDYDVKFGQGFLFSPPRPVRAEALGGDAAEPGKTEAGKSDKDASLRDLIPEATPAE